MDLKPLNENILARFILFPGWMRHWSDGSKGFLKAIDANSGFWQIPLTSQSKLLTTFVTPYRRYYKLPFRISSAPEHFQKRMSNSLSGLEGVLCLMDDICVFGRTMAEHDNQLKNAPQRIAVAETTLNPDKCEYGKLQLKFLGHNINDRGIQAGPEKKAAIQKNCPPKNITELRRFLGMVNQLGKSSRNLAQLTKLLRELLS